jgi:hypothetical protein
METLDQNLLDKPEQGKQRHGCVTAWLILMIIGNSMVALFLLFAGNFIGQTQSLPIPPSMLIILSILGIVNVICAIMLMQWKKIGFWGFIITSVIAFGINIQLELGIGQSVSGLISIGILYAILQIRKNGVSAWENMN